MRSPRTLRGRLTALAFLAALIAVAALTVAFNLAVSSILGSEARSRLRTEAEAATATIVADHGRLRVREAPADEALDGLVWVFQGDRAVERPPGRPGLQRLAAAVAERPGTFLNVSHLELRLYAQRVRVHGTPGTVVVGGSTEAYDRTDDLALLASLAFGGALLLAVLLVTRSVIRRALGPVEEMTALAADWGEHDLGRRFGIVPRPDELGRLAQTFDGLLDRVAAGMRREQRFSAEVSHELRTPLSRIVAEVELLLRRDRPADERREAYASIARGAEQMSTILETLMAAARAEGALAPGRCDLQTALGALAAEWERALPADRGVGLDVRVPGRPLPAGVDPEVLARILAPLVDNAARHARARVAVAAERRAGAVVVHVRDDGPGVPAEVRELIFEPGAQPGPAGAHAGAGLGLALARRLARAAGGDVAVAPAAAPEGGADFAVTLPA